MNKKILLGCFDVPGWGGASTSTYKLFELMRDDGLEVAFLNIIAEKDADYFRYLFGEKIGSPKGLENVYNCFLEGPTFHPQPKLEKLINKIDADVIVAVGWIASLLIKNEAPTRKVIYITSGCDQVDKYIIKGGWSDLISICEHIQKSNNDLQIISQAERQAVDSADLIIAHSDINFFLYKYFFRRLSGKIYPETIWFAEWIYKDALDYEILKKPFNEREIDIIFVASSWSRPEKNYKLLKKITSRLKDLNIHVAGELEKKDKNATYHDLITNREVLFGLLGNAKTIICQSIFDSAPGILFEASAMGCNIIASKNCGNWMLCNEELLVDPFNLTNFLDRISLSLKRKYNDNIDFFLNTNSYKRLIETISLF